MRQRVASLPPLPVFADLHCRAESLEVCVRVLQGLRADALAMGAPVLGFLGDFFHVRGIMPVAVQNAILDELDKFAEARLRVVFIPGNHDQIDVQGRNALEVFGSHPAVKLYEHPTRDEYGLWIPYLHELEQVRELLARERPRGGRVFWHGPMLGAAMNDTTLSDRGLRLEDFAGFDLAVLGHFHKRQSFGHVHYVGSPWQTRSDERGQPKGYGIVQGTRLEYQDRDWGPRHVVLTAETPEALVGELAAYGPQDLVRVQVPEAQVEQAHRLLAGRFRDLVVTPVRAEVQTARAISGEARSIEDHARRYVEERAGDLDRAELLRAFEEITR